jgi:DNA-binding transcriptional ArsR family regulator
MVVRQLDEEHDDRVFSALGDATRRDILRRAALAEHSVSALARHYPVSFAAVQKHVAVLERAGLVLKRRHGREHLVSTDVTTVRHAREQLELLEALWRDRLDRFGDVLAALPRTELPSTRGPQEDR